MSLSRARAVQPAHALDCLIERLMDNHLGLGIPIAIGRTAEVFVWGDGRIIKLTRSDFPAHLADQEWQQPVQGGLLFKGGRDYGVPGETIKEI